jgi:hypothetical protein
MWFNYEYRRARLLKESRRTNPYSPGVPMGAFELPLGSLAGEVEGRVSKWKEVIGTPMQACSP